MKESCDKCYFWFQTTFATELKQRGICRRYPPTVVSSDVDSQYQVFPKTQGKEGCGEFVATEDKKKEMVASLLADLFKQIS